MPIELGANVAQDMDFRGLTARHDRQRGKSSHVHTAMMRLPLGRTYVCGGCLLVARPILDGRFARLFIIYPIIATTDGSYYLWLAFPAVRTVAGKESFKTAAAL